MRTGQAAPTLAFVALLPALAAAMLPPCPSSPNCVSTEAHDTTHAIAPIAFDVPPPVAADRLRRALATLPRLRIVADDGRRIRAEAKSRLFRFVDDVDLVIDSDARVIRMRSASRTGYWDVGANRRRLERIRAAWQATP
jgi:uncharacterized protein (DUF1499 family)